MRCINKSELQRDLLQQMGCDLIQGYLYSKPLPRAEFGRFL
jgi:EAL domain-containing protein (putative c-di-GMP-specific phosphodiesterase class I)